MKLSDIKVEKIPQDWNLNGIYKQIEIGGRNAYQSEPKEGVTSKDFVDMLISRNHLSCLEHGTVYLTVFVPKSKWNKEYTIYDFYSNNPYSKLTFQSKGFKESNEFNKVYITTNMRVIIENSRESDLKYLTQPKYCFHHKRTTFYIVCPISITRELNRHRVLSITEQSTRYCNFSKDRFGNELTFIKPEWFDDSTKLEKDSFCDLLEEAEINYMNLIKFSLAPQYARDILPLCTQSKVIYTAFDTDWEDIISKRNIPQAHPQAQKIAKLIKKLL